MIGVFRRIDPRPDVRGLQIFTMADWISPPTEVAAEAFLAFDVTYRKMRLDPEATKIRPLDAGPDADEITAFHTAREAAIRATPERLASGIRIVSAFVHMPSRRLWSDLPAWMHLCLESSDGTLDALVAGGKIGWRRIDLRPNDVFVHAAPFQPLADLRIPKIEGVRAFRLAPSIEESQGTGTAPFRLELPVGSSAEALP